MPLCKKAVDPGMMLGGGRSGVIRQVDVVGGGLVMEGSLSEDKDHFEEVGFHP